ncbi:hypothetical protein [Pseudomonas sp. LB1P83]
MSNANKNLTNTPLKITTVLDAKGKSVLPEGELSTTEGFATFSGTCKSWPEERSLFLRAGETDGGYQFPVDANITEWSTQVWLNEPGLVNHNLVDEETEEESDAYPINWV